MLHSAGPMARGPERLWWFAFWVAAIVYVITIGALLWAAWRAHRRQLVLADADAEPRMKGAVTIGAAASVVILLVFLVYDLSVGGTLSPAPKPGGRPPLVIQVIGHQWWWEARYAADTTAHGAFTTANELHIPVGQPVVLELTSQDVIHSVWVPNLSGKKDLVPGYTQSVWFQADSAGVYRGQCAEFCGMQHALMALEVIAEPPQEYARWVAGQLQPAKSPVDSVAQRGQQVFLEGTCAMCHNIEGIQASSNAGPDLTHLASRRTIAAGTLPNTRGNLAGWIVNPQRIKPGSRMPPNALEPKDLDALLTYLQTLK